MRAVHTVIIMLGIADEIRTIEQSPNADICQRIRMLLCKCTVSRKHLFVHFCMSGNILFGNCLTGCQLIVQAYAQLIDTDLNAAVSECFHCLFHWIWSRPFEQYITFHTHAVQKRIGRIGLQILDQFFDVVGFWRLEAVKVVVE